MDVACLRQPTTWCSVPARFACSRDKLAAFTFWGWQLVILAAALSLPLGYTQGKEYAELEWPIDILITLVWVAFAVVFFGTVGTRKVRHIYVANWFLRCLHPCGGDCCTWSTAPPFPPVP